MRKMASIQRIAEVASIEGADAICAYRVDGWWVVDRVGAYQQGDLAIFCEVDAWIPHELAPFLSKGKDPREYNGVKGERLRTVKLRGTLSQGLLLPLSIRGEVSEDKAATEDMDVSEELNIQKYEPPVPAQLAGQVRGNFPTIIPKTDAERIQNVRDWAALATTHTFEATEKLHGSSCTFYLDAEGEFHVCSRNMDLKFDENNAFWRAAIKYDVENKMRSAELLGVALQGELIGAGINGNQYKVQDIEFRLFNIYSVNGGTYLTADAREHLNGYALGLPTVPTLNIQVVPDVAEMLKLAEGKSLLNGSEREGFVLKSLQDPSIIIKVISNKWLLKGGEDQ